MTPKLETVKYPDSDHYFSEPGGHLWCPSGLSQEQLAAEIESIVYRRNEGLQVYGDTRREKALINEVKRRLELEGEDHKSAVLSRLFPNTDRTYKSAGEQWTPRSLDDEALQRKLDVYNFRQKEGYGARGDKQRIKALCDEKMRRLMLKQVEQHEESTMETPKPAAPNATLAADELLITITDADGNVWGDMIAEPTTFKSGSSGYVAREKIRLPCSRTRFMVQWSAVLIGSKPKEQAPPLKTKPE